MKLFTTIFFLLTLSIAALPARAGQGSSGSELCEVRGSAEDKDNKPIVSAVIYLQNVRSLAVRTYISDDHGQYHFSDLFPNEDYELHAEVSDETSSNHIISIFNRHEGWSSFSRSIKIKGSATSSDSAKTPA
jgi:hypothetical protein